MAKTVRLSHKTLGDVTVAEADFLSDGKDGHGWSKKETEARGFKLVVEKAADADGDDKGDKTKGGEKK